MDVDLTLDDLLARVRRLEAELTEARSRLAQRAEPPATPGSAESLRESEARYRAVLEYAPAQVLLVEEGRITFANPAAARILGYQRPEEMFGLPALEVVAEPYRDLVRARIANIAAGSANPPLEIQFRRQDGSLTWSQVTSAPLTLNGRCVALACGIDVNAGIEAKAALRRSEELLRDTFEAIPDLMMVIDRQSRVELSNWHGGNAVPEDARTADLHCWEVCCKQPRPCGSCPAERVFATGVQHRQDVTDAVTARVYDVSVYPVHDAQGDVHRVVCHLRDVTESRRIEAENARMQDGLRTAQRLESLGTLASGLAHDFNNILGIIQGRVSLLLADPEARQRNQDDLLTIEGQVATAANLTRQLLDYGRRGAQQMRPLDLNGAVVESAAIFGRTRKDIRIETRLDPDLPAVEGDVTQISQALLNLYVNAADAMPGGGRLELRTARTTSAEMGGRNYHPVPGHYVRLSVTDTGTGIPPAVLPHIFEPFFTTKERGCGTGLGLASVYGAMKTCQGYVDVDSTPGRGTTFNLYFPATGLVVDAAAAPARTVTAGRGVVLLIDDEDQVRETTTMMLRRLGYEVAPAADGPAALAIQVARRQEITMVILDLHLPGMGGHQVFDQLRLSTPGVPVLLSSGSAFEGSELRLLAEDGVSFLQKPYTLQGLSQALAKALAPR